MFIGEGRQGDGHDLLPLGLLFARLSLSRLSSGGHACFSSSIFFVHEAYPLTFAGVNGANHSLWHEAHRIGSERE